MLIKTLVAAGMLAYSIATIACSEAEKNALVKNNTAMQELSSRFANCTTQPKNSSRAECWRNKPLPANEDAIFEQLVDGHRSIIAKCPIARLHFNLADFQSMFGRFCDAWSEYEAIRESESFENLRVLKTEAALTCIRQKKVGNESDLEPFHYMVWTEVRNPKMTKTVALRKQRGRLLGAWRDAFYVESQSSDMARTASVIDKEERIWGHWENFLEQLRSHVRGFDPELRPMRGQLPKTIKQLNLAKSEL